MPHGTTIKEAYIPRVHRSNAKQVLEQCESDIESIKMTLCALIACTPSPEMIADTPIDVEQFIEEIRQHSFMAWGASQILDFPEDVVDDYDNQ